MALGPIPWTSINQYARNYRLDLDEQEVLEHHIRVLERTEDAHREKAEKRKGKPHK